MLVRRLLTLPGGPTWLLSALDLGFEGSTPDATHARRCPTRPKIRACQSALPEQLMNTLRAKSQRVSSLRDARQLATGHGISMT